MDAVQIAEGREWKQLEKEPEKFWKELEDGKYDWSYTLMRYWPERVRLACKWNKSGRDSPWAGRGV